MGGVYTQNAIDCGFNFEEASNLTLQQLTKQIREKNYLTFAYFKEKFEIAWGDCSAETWWVDCSLKEESHFLMKGNWTGQIFDITQCYWVLICFFVCVHSFCFLKKENECYMFFCLIMFGFALLLVLSEVQGRYKCVMYPYISILAAEGFERSIGRVSSFIFCNN